MAKRIQVSESTARRIQIREASVRRIDPQAVADSLGAEPVPEHLEGQPGPITLHALRSELFRRRLSSGGRPGIEGTNLRAKIPLNDQDWAGLEAIAESLSTEGFSPSAGQVASVLLSLALRSVTLDREPREKTPPARATELATELAARMAAEKTR